MDAGNRGVLYSHRNGANPEEPARCSRSFAGERVRVSVPAVALRCGGLGPELASTEPSEVKFGGPHLSEQTHTQPNALAPVNQKFILHWGEMGTRWGINRTVAQVHALLFLSPRPVPADEIRSE